METRCVAVPPVHCRRAGFTLLELAIVLVIFSAVAVMGLEAVSMLLARRAYTTTQERLAALDDAMVRFYKVYHRLPCPADRTLLPSNTSYGSEGTCALASGMVPFRAMNLPAAAVMDGYGNRINYVTTLALASSSATFDATGAALEVRSGILQHPCTTNCSVLANPATGSGAAYFLFSNGADGRGAISQFGAARATCSSGAGDTRIDTQNCSPGTVTVMSGQTTVYYDSRFNNGTTAANYYDDIAIWRVKGRLF